MTFIDIKGSCYSGVVIQAHLNLLSVCVVDVLRTKFKFWIKFSNRHASK